MPASMANSSRRSPGTRRRPDVGRPVSSGRITSRLARRYSPNAVLGLMPRQYAPPSLINRVEQWRTSSAHFSNETLVSLTDTNAQSTFARRACIIAHAFNLYTFFWRTDARPNRCESGAARRARRLLDARCVIPDRAAGANGEWKARRQTDHRARARRVRRRLR